MKKCEITVDGVLKAINKIDATTHDPEVAHGLEDDLWREVLGAIGYGDLSAEEARELAAAALRSRTVKFPRWSA